MKHSEQIAAWIKAQVEKTGKKGAIFGLSGGIDSAVLGALLKKAIGDNVLALILPCNSDPKDEALAIEAAKKFNIKTKALDIADIYDTITALNPAGTKLSKANIKPRLRMIVLYYFANVLDYIVAGASNKSELTIGYFTKFGDGGADILPLGGVLKKEVRKLAIELGVPDDIIKRQPTAGLWENQTDEKEMGITYEVLDKTIEAIERNDESGISKAALDKVKRMIENSEHKRSKIPIFKI